MKTITRTPITRIVLIQMIMIRMDKDKKAINFEYENRTLLSLNASEANKGGDSQSSP